MKLPPLKLPLGPRPCRLLLLLLLVAPLSPLAAPRGAPLPGTPAARGPDATRADELRPGEAGSAAMQEDPAAPPVPSVSPVRAASAAAGASASPEGAVPRREPASLAVASAGQAGATQASTPAQRSFSVAVGPLFPLDSDGTTAPRLALQLTGPVALSALTARGNLRLEWLATAALRYAERERVGFSGTSELSTLGAELMPGLRVLSAVHPRLDVSLELSAGLSVLRARSTTRTSAGALQTRDTDWGGVARVALGGQVPLDERLRLYVEPAALQLYVGSGASVAWSMQFGLAYTF